MSTGVGLYDEALLSKLNKWTNTTSMHVYGPDSVQELFRTLSDESNDQPIQLPLIAVSRSPGYSILNKNKRPLAYDGLTLDANVNRSLQLNAIPISVSYQIDLYTRYWSEADEYMRNIVYNIINYPLLSVEIPYNDVKYIHNSSIRLISEVEDNSSIPERLVPGQFTRLTVNISIDDAYLWDARVRDNYQLDVVVDEQ